MRLKWTRNRSSAWAEKTEPAGSPHGAGMPMKKPPFYGGFEFLAEWTGLEPATPGVTGRYSNQLNYHSTRQRRSGLRRKCRPTCRACRQPGLASPRGFEPL
jgi:hypothetical protein